MRIGDFYLHANSLGSRGGGNFFEAVSYSRQQQMGIPDDRTVGVGLSGCEQITRNSD